MNEAERGDPNKSFTHDNWPEAVILLLYWDQAGSEEEIPRLGVEATRRNV